MNKTKTSKLIPLLLCALMLASCSSKTVLDEERQFDRDIWNRFTPEVFSYNISDIESYYNIDVTVAVNPTTYRYDEVPLAINLNSSNGESRRILTSVALKENGHWRGEMEDDYRVATGRIRSYFSFNTKGTYDMEVGQQTSQYDLEGIHSVAVTITKTKVDYNL